MTNKRVPSDTLNAPYFSTPFIASAGCTQGYQGPYFSELTMSMFGSVSITLMANGAAKLDHDTDTNNCSAATGRVASQPLKKARSISVQGIGAVNPFNKPTAIAPSRNSTCVSPSSSVTWANFAKYRLERDTGKESICFQPPPACSYRHINAENTPANSGKNNIACASDIVDHK